MFMLGKGNYTHFPAISKDGEAEMFKQAQQNFMKKDWLLEIAKDFWCLINLKLEVMEAVNYDRTFPVVEEHALVVMWRANKESWTHLNFFLTCEVL